MYIAKKKSLTGIITFSVMVFSSIVFMQGCSTTTEVKKGGLQILLSVLKMIKAMEKPYSNRKRGSSRRRVLWSSAMSIKEITAAMVTGMGMGTEKQV